MTLPPAIADLVVDAAAQEIAKRAGCYITDLQLLTYKAAAEMLGVSQPTARRIIAEYVELGEATRRVKLSTLRAMIEARTFRNGECRGKTAGGVMGQAKPFLPGAVGGGATTGGTFCVGDRTRDTAGGGLGAAAGQRDNITKP